jgi:hypothetical protein
LHCISGLSGLLQAGGQRGAVGVAQLVAAAAFRVRQPAHDGSGADCAKQDHRQRGDDQQGVLPPYGRAGRVGVHGESFRLG